MPLKIAGLSKKEILEKVNTALATVNLNGKEKQKANTLSGGEKQRVAIVNDPKNYICGRTNWQS